MKKILSFAKKKKGFSPNSSDTGSVLSVGYEIKEKDLGKVHKAASTGDLAKLKQHAKKHDINQLDKENRTPLHIACANGHAEVVQFLVENKAKLNLCDNQNRSPLMKAVQCQQERCALILLEHDANPNLVDISGNTALHLAALIPSFSLAVQLLEHDANINARNKDGCTPLTLAVTENHVEMAEFLLKEGADVNATDQAERTSLMVAACNGQISLVRLLLLYDADISMKDTKGWTSDDYAVINGHHACSHLIIEHGTKRKFQKSPSHLAPNKKKPVPAEVGLSLGGPATNREELQSPGTSEAGKVDEDNSQADSLSRASKGGVGDSWPSSEEDEELDLGPKKPQKLNLKKLMTASQKDRQRTDNVIADPDKSWSEGESEQEREGAVKKNPTLPTALLPSATSLHPVSFSPTSFPKLPQMTSTPLHSSRKGADSKECYGEEEDDDEDDEDAEEYSSEEKESGEPENLAFGSVQKSSHVFHNLSLQKGDASSNNAKRDFLSELGLEGDDSQWDSESGSDSPQKRSGDFNSPVMAQKLMIGISEESNEDLFYVPSFLRGPRNYRMCNLEPPRRIERPGDQKALVSIDAGLEEKVLSPLPVSAILKENSSVKTDPSDGPSACPASSNILCYKEAPVLEEEHSTLKEEDRWSPPQALPPPSSGSPPQTHTQTLPPPSSGSTPQTHTQTLPPPSSGSPPQTHTQTLPPPSSGSPPQTHTQTLPPPSSGSPPQTRTQTLPPPSSGSPPQTRTQTLPPPSSGSPPQTHTQALPPPSSGSPPQTHTQTLPPPSSRSPPQTHTQTLPLPLPRTRKPLASHDDEYETQPPVLCPEGAEGVSGEKPQKGPLEVDGERKPLDVQKVGLLTDGQTEQSVLELKKGETQRRQLKTHACEKERGIPEMGQPLKIRDGNMQRSSKNSKSAGMALEQDGVDKDEGILQLSALELNTGVGHSRPQQAAHVNGDPLSVFDDSTLSEVSEDDGRSTDAGNPNGKDTAEMEMINFDDLTQSSDTTTEEVDSPTSGYRNASLLIRQLEASSIDSVIMVKLQNTFHEYERTIQREKGRYDRVSDKVSQLGEERCELKRGLEEMRGSRSVLEHRLVELETDLHNLRFVLKQEQEKHRNTSMLYDKSLEQLRRKEEQYRSEVEERQKVELTVRNLELEMRALVNSMKQLEEDRSETQRMLTQERSARAVQEGILDNHLRKQKETEEENRRNQTMSQLTEASDREKDLLQQSHSLQEEVATLKLDLEQTRARCRQEEVHLSEENETLRERLEDARRDLKLNEEALAQTVYQYNSQLAALKAEGSVVTAKLEHERQTRERLEAEAESGQARLTAALLEVDRSQAARADGDRVLQREREDWQRVQEKGVEEIAKQRESIHNLSQQLGIAEAKVNSLENECYRATISLTERNRLLETTQRERDQDRARIKELEAALLVEKEQAGRARALQDATQQRLAEVQSEGMLLHQQLEEAQNKGVVKERAVTDAQERFTDLLAKLRLDSEERVRMVEERSRELLAKTAALREQLDRQEHDKTKRETTVRELQQELADTLKKLSMSEASLEVNSRYRNDLEEEKLRMQKDMDRLRGKLQESDVQLVEAERRIHKLKSVLDDKEREVLTTSQKLQEVVSASTGAERTARQLEETTQRLEIENARLEAVTKQQTNRLELLERGAQEGAVTSDSSPARGVRNRLEELVTNLQGHKMNLEEQLNREVQKRSVLSHNAEDSHTLWEEELKTRSRLGLRLAELEREKGELFNQMEIEKRKAKKIAEQKRSADVRLDQEMKRNTELQKEMYRLKTLVKSAKKKLREQDNAESGSPLSSLRGNLGQRRMNTEAAVTRMMSKVDELSVQLEMEALKCSQLEMVNTDLKEQLSSIKVLSKSREQLEEEVSGLRRHMETGMMDQSQAEQYRRETEERARQEIRQKLEEVNLFLQTQAASQEALGQIKAANEASLRNRLELRIRDLEGELARVRSSQQDSLSQRDSAQAELERYRELYTEELRLRKALAAKLERSKERLSEANARLLGEHQRNKSLIASSIVNGSMAGPSLDIGAYGATLGPLNRSLGLGGSFLSPVGNAQNTRVEAYLAQMQNELEKNISKELDNATAELGDRSARVSPVGSAADSLKGFSTDQDAVSRATQQYLEVLKKNYMI